jgi:Tol biopolymer transport system component
MKRPIALTVLMLASLWIPAAGRVSDAPLESAALAWERGDYVTALTRYLQILDSPEAESSHETIALQTGELFHTTEITTDGTSPLFAPDGQHLLYETGPALSRQIRLFKTAAPATVAGEIPGFGAAFSPDGSALAYLALTPSSDLRELQAGLDAATASERQQRQTAVTQRIAEESQIIVRNLATGTETRLEAGPVRKASLALAADGSVLFAGTAVDAPPNAPSQLYVVSAGQPATALTNDAGSKAPLAVAAGGEAVLFTIRTGGGGRGRAGGAGGTPATFGLLNVKDRRATTITGTAPAFSGDGRSLTYVDRDGTDNRIVIAPVSDPTKVATAYKGTERVDAPALSRDGARVVFQMMAKEDWELYVANRDGGNPTRLSREIQHDLLPRFLTDDRVLAVVGEARHRRSYLYDLTSGKRSRLFHNNTVRTIAPEYSWSTSADGTKVLISAERDGDTVSAERGVYLVDLARRVTLDELRARVRTNLDAERALRAKGTRMYGAIAEAVRTVTAQASVDRVFSYEKALFDFDSKHITRPGNKLASEYLFNKYKSFGYEPEYQWFAGRGALGGQTANVIATLKGTVNPELVYVVSSHYDSVAVGPGADDDTSGTAALLEAARIMAGHPQPATIVFASFTGEEAGLLGSREYVRRAVADKLKLVGALNNDMVGWANDQRLDNTIRYSNPGIRDIQHAAAMQFSNMITYDALYYKSTDAAAYYDAYGDIVGGIGSYPVLGNPHYHQAHDLLDTINHQLVTEVAKTTAATLMLLSSSPSRLTDLKVNSFANGTAMLSWTPSPEKGVTDYLVAYGPASKPEAHQVKVTGPQATVKGIAPGTVVSVKAVNAKGLEGWDWARVTVK